MSSGVTSASHQENLIAEIECAKWFHKDSERLVVAMLKHKSTDAFAIVKRNNEQNGYKAIYFEDSDLPSKQIMQNAFTVEKDRIRLSSGEVFDSFDDYLTALGLEDRFGINDGIPIFIKVSKVAPSAINHTRPAAKAPNSAGFGVQSPLQRGYVNSAFSCRSVSS